MISEWLVMGQFRGKKALTVHRGIFREVRSGNIGNVFSKKIMVSISNQNYFSKC